MPASTRPLLPLLASSALLLIPSASVGESVLLQQGKASAALDFRIIIPPVLRVLENSHPQQLDGFADGEASAEQRLVVMSNMKRGFCVSLRHATAQLSTWEVQIAPQSGIHLSPVADGYRLCGTRAGQYTVLLKHRFGTSEGNASAIHWPVQTDISAI